eukprot:961194_1
MAYDPAQDKWHMIHTKKDPHLAHIMRKIGPGIGDVKWYPHRQIHPRQVIRINDACYESQPPKWQPVDCSTFGDVSTDLLTDREINTKIDPIMNPICFKENPVEWIRLDVYAKKPERSCDESAPPLPKHGPLDVEKITAKKDPVVEEFAAKKDPKVEEIDELFNTWKEDVAKWKRLVEEARTITATGDKHRKVDLQPKRDAQEKLGQCEHEIGERITELGRKSSDGLSGELAPRYHTWRMIVKRDCDQHLVPHYHSFQQSFYDALGLKILLGKTWHAVPDRFAAKEQYFDEYEFDIDDGHVTYQSQRSRGTYRVFYYLYVCHTLHQPHTAHQI